MIKFIMMMGLLGLASCGSTIYKPTDYAEACVDKQDQELADNISHECLPVDTYEEAIHYHQTYSNEYRKMPDLDSAMQFRSP